MPYTPDKSVYSGPPPPLSPMYIPASMVRSHFPSCPWFWTWCCLSCLKVLSPLSPSATLLHILQDQVPVSSLQHHFLMSQPWTGSGVSSMLTIPCFPLSLHSPVLICTSAFTVYCKLLSHILTMHFKYKAGTQWTPTCVFNKWIKQENAFGSIISQ